MLPGSAGAWPWEAPTALLGVAGPRAPSSAEPGLPNFTPSLCSFWIGQRSTAAPSPRAGDEDGDMAGRGDRPGSEPGSPSHKPSVHARTPFTQP